MRRVSGRSSRLLLLGLWALAACSKPAPVLTTGSFSVGDGTCGITPPPGKSYTAPGPSGWGRKAFELRAGREFDVKRPITATFVTTSSGLFSVSVPPGEWCVSEASVPQGNAPCLDKRRHRCLVILKVPGNADYLLRPIDDDCHQECRLRD